MNLNNDIRWKQRFQNFSKAFTLLREVFEEFSIEELSPLEKEGAIQRFEYTYELSWKTLKDYLEYSGTNISEVTARNVFKEAFSAGIIKNQDVFVEMMLSRNLLAHVYDFEKFNEVLVKIKSSYLQALSELYEFFLERAVSDD